MELIAPPFSLSFVRSGSMKEYRYSKKKCKEGWRVCRSSAGTGFCEEIDKRVRVPYNRF